MSTSTAALNEHLDRLAREVKRLQRLARPPRPPRWPWVFAALLAVGGSIAVLRALRCVEEVPPMVAPITPTGDAAQHLWLP
jgi:hypothetical protein